MREAAGDVLALAYLGLWWLLYGGLGAAVLLAVPAAASFRAGAALFGG